MKPNAHFGRFFSSMLIAESCWTSCSKFSTNTGLQLYKQYKGQLWTSPATLIELLLLAAEFKMDPQRLLVDVMALAELRGGEPDAFLMAASYMMAEGSHVFDSLHAAFCGTDCQMISSDKVFDRLGLNRIPLGKDTKAA